MSRRELLALALALAAVLAVTLPLIPPVKPACPPWVAVFGQGKPEGPGISVFGPMCREQAEKYAADYGEGTRSSAEPLFVP